MAVDSLTFGFQPSTPDDLNDPPRFGQLHETCRDVVSIELKNFFRNAKISATLRSEVPTIQKYSIRGDSTDRFSTAVNIIQRLADKPEQLPHIAVMSSASRERKIAVGIPYIGDVQDPSFIQTPLAEPYTLVDGTQLILGFPGNLADTITFTADRFPTGNPIGAALAVDVARVINEQAQYCRAQVITISNVNYVQIYACTAYETPRAIEVLPTSNGPEVILGIGRRSGTVVIGGTRPNMTLTAAPGTWSSSDIGHNVTISGSDYFNDGVFPITAVAGNGSSITFTSKYGKVAAPSGANWFIGYRDDWKNVAHPPKRRYSMAQNVTMQIDVYAEDDNTRTELVDLLASFWTFYKMDTLFTFCGRSLFQGTTIAGEYYQIFQNGTLSSTAETEIARPNGDGTAKLCVCSFNIELAVFQYLDRVLLYPGTAVPFISDLATITENDTLPVTPGS